MTDDNNAARIAALNDRFRTTLGLAALTGALSGRIVMAAGIADLPEEDQTEILRKVREFNAFTEDNDPHGEHDSGAFDHADEKILWKIDYYASDLKSGSEDPADMSLTVRVLTILLASEW